MAGTEITGTLTGRHQSLALKNRLRDVTPEQALDTLRTVADKLEQRGKTLVLTSTTDSRKPLVFKRWNDASAYRRQQAAQAIRILLDRAAQGVSEHRLGSLRSALAAYLDRDPAAPRARIPLIDRGIRPLVTAVEQARKQQLEARENAQAANPVAPAVKAAEDPAKPAAQAPVPDLAAGATAAPSERRLVKALGDELMALRNADTLSSLHPVRVNRRELILKLDSDLSGHPGLIGTRLSPIQDRLRRQVQENPAGPAVDVYQESVKVLAQELFGEATLIAELGLNKPGGKSDTRLSPDQWQSLQTKLLNLQVRSLNPSSERLRQSIDFLRTNIEACKSILSDEQATDALLRYLLSGPEAIDGMAVPAVILGARLSPVMSAAYHRVQFLEATGSPSPTSDVLPQIVTGAGVVAARMLLNDQGILDLNGARDLKFALEKNGPPPEFHSDLVPWYGRVLGALESNAELVKTLEEIQAPEDQTSPSASMIRSTLGLSATERVTALHARQAVLAAMLTPLRQGTVGSCFATSVAIRIQQQQLLQMVQDMAKLISSGELVFTRSDGSIKRLLLSETASASALSESIALPDSKQARAAIQSDPGLSAALHAVGIKADEIESRIGEAIDSIDARASAAGGDRSTTVAEIIDEVLFAKHGITRADLDEHKKVPQLIQDVLRGELELEALRTSPNLANAQNAIDAKISDIEKLIDERLDIAGRPSAPLMPQFLDERDLAVSAWQGTQDNRILRAWEYTLSARAESNVSDRFMQPLSQALGAAVLKELDSGNPRVESPLRDQVTKEIERLVAERLDYVYDASMQSELAADGSSTEGGFVLVDIGRPGSGDLPTRITSAETFQMIMAALSAEALQSVAATLPQGSARSNLQAAGRQLTGAWFSSRPASAGAKTLLDNVTLRLNYLRSKRNKESEAGLPWALPDGYNANAVLTLRAGEVALAKRDAMPAAGKGARHSPEDVVVFLIDQVRKLPQPVADAIDADPEYFSLPMSKSGHAFLFKPGLKTSLGASGISAARQASAGIDSRTWLRDGLKPGCDALGAQAIPERNLPLWLEFIGRAVSKEPKLDRLALGDPNSKGFADWRARVVNQAGQPVTWKGLRQAVANDLRAELNAGEFQFSILDSLPDAQRGQREADLKRSIEDRLRVLMQPVDSMIVQALNPPVIVLADLNWGNGIEPHHLGVTYNPVSGESEFWQCGSAQGTALLRPLHQESWVSGISLISSPSLLGVGPP